MARIDKILIANRGEIAVRIIHTCKRMGIATVAAFSDADEDAIFVRLADEAVRLGPAPAAESYLDFDKVIGAAELTGANAIHPGYGFLAENAAFAQACADRGVTFIGPSPEVIRVLGSKIESKQRVAEADVPVIPGSKGGDQSVEALSAHATEIGFPVLLKASAGGGGKGMYVVREASELADAIESAKRVSGNAFGDDTLLVEKYIDNPRHVEIQILGDQHGTLIHLFERECSIQRRHQKIVEETPSPAVDDDLRARMGAAAVAVGNAVGYYNAGTVEFILAPDGQFYFLEVNTRLQVEHPVTECVTGVDLVREQIRVARGERLSIAQHDLTMNGAAIECRLYAEDADEDFRPAAGRIVSWHAPELEGLRIDTGVESGTDVGIHYDPMLAKVIAHAPTRIEAIQKLSRALQLMSVDGITTNREFLVRVLAHPEMVAGNIDTHFLDTHVDDLRAPERDIAVVQRAAIATTLLAHELRRASRSVLPNLEPGYRNHRVADERVVYDAGEDEVPVGYVNRRGGRFDVRIGDGDYERVRIIACADGVLEYEAGNGHRRRFRIVRDEATVYVHSDDGAVTLVERPRFPEREAAAVEGGCVAPMPGKVVKVLVSADQEVSAGDTLLILEAMKMEHSVTAPADGVVTALCVDEGDQVDTDQLLVVIG
jgi:acetyl-CoA carboxylase biotin carboxylase subunit